MSSSFGTAGGRLRCQRSRPVLLLRQGEVDDRVEPADERLVDVRAQVRREDRQAVERLHPLEQVGDLDVRVPIARVLDLAPLAEERVGLVEQQDAVDPVGLGEDAVEVLLGLADVLVDDGRQVDDVQVEAEVAREHLRGHRLAGARIAREERGDARGAGCCRRPSPTPRSPCRGGGRGRSARGSAPRLRRAGRGRPSSRPARCAARAAPGRPRSGRARRWRCRRRSSGAPPATVTRRAASAARTIWSGASRNASVTTAGSKPIGRSPLSEPSHSSWRWAIVGTGARAGGPPRAPRSGSHGRLPIRTTGARHSANASDGGRAALRQRLDRARRRCPLPAARPPGRPQPRRRGGCRSARGGRGPAGGPGARARPGPRRASERPDEPGRSWT